jgi:hypothetical protein
VADPNWLARDNDIYFQTFLCALFTPVLDGLDEICMDLRRRAEYSRQRGRISAGAREAWARRRAKWGKRGRAA